MEWLRYQRVISLETQVGVTSQINKWANTDPRTYQRWDHVPRRSEHPLSMANVKVFEKWVKLQGHEVKYYGTNRKVLS
jgi:hypothetical protein